MCVSVFLYNVGSTIMYKMSIIIQFMKKQQVNLNITIVYTLFNIRDYIIKQIILDNV